MLDSEYARPGVGEVLADLRELLDDPGAELGEAYPVWILAAGDRLENARPTGLVHHQVRTRQALAYACSSVRDGRLELDEVGEELAARVRAAAAQLGPRGEARLLRVSPCQAMVLWDSADDRLVTVDDAPRQTTIEELVEELVHAHQSHRAPR